MRKETNGQRRAQKGQRLRAYPFCNLGLGRPMPRAEPSQRGLTLTDLIMTKDLDSSPWICHIKASSTFRFLTVKISASKALYKLKGEYKFEDLLEQAFF